MIFPIGDDQIKGGYYPFASYGFLALNILVFLFERFYLGFPQGLGLEFGAIPVEILQGENIHTLFTSMFLHADWLHLAFNMLFLWIFADNIEAIIGTRRFILFYILGGLAAHAAHIYFNPGSIVPTVGASGAIAAVMGAYMVMFPKSMVRVLIIVFPVRVPSFLFLGFWIWGQWMDGQRALQYVDDTAGGVAYWAHIGGFVFGLLAGFYYRSTYPMTPERKEEEEMFFR